MLPFIFQTILSVDVELSGQVYSAQSKLFQRKLMHDLIVDADGMPFIFGRRYLTRQGVDPDDECQWRGVECVEGTITSFVTGGNLIDHLRIRMQLFPSTLRAIYLRQVNLFHGWSAQTLPRDLRFLYMSITSAHERFSDLRKLPGKLEEIHCMQPMGYWHGQIDLRSLPPSLRILQIMAVIKGPIIANDSAFPENIKRVRIAYRVNSTKKRSVLTEGEELNRNVLECNYTKLELSDSLYWAKYLTRLTNTNDEIAGQRYIQ